MDNNLSADVEPDVVIEHILREDDDVLEACSVRSLSIISDWVHVCSCV